MKKWMTEFKGDGINKKKKNKRENKIEKKGNMFGGRKRVCVCERKETKEKKSAGIK